MGFDLDVTSSGVLGVGGTTPKSARRPFPKPILCLWRLRALHSASSAPLNLGFP